MKTAEEYTPEEIKELEAKIDSMTQEEMAQHWRFAPSGDPMFHAGLDLFKRFNERFKSLGGMTPEISNRIGW